MKDREELVSEIRESVINLIEAFRGKIPGEVQFSLNYSRIKVVVLTDQERKQLFCSSISVGAKAIERKLKKELSRAQRKDAAEIKVDPFAVLDNVQVPDHVEETTQEEAIEPESEEAPVEETTQEKTVVPEPDEAPVEETTQEEAVEPESKEAPVEETTQEKAVVPESKEEAVVEQVEATITEPTPAKEPRYLDWIGKILKKIEDQAKFANRRMSRFASGKDLEELEISVDSDSAGIYLHSGRIPLMAVARMGDPIRIFQTAKDAIWRIVDESRNAMERRARYRSEAAALRDRDIDARVLCLNGRSPDALGRVDVGAREAMVSAAKKAVSEANAADEAYKDLFDALYGSSKVAKFTLTGFSGGLVVKGTAGEEYFVCRFPKFGNTRESERTIAYINSQVRGIAESRRRYAMRVHQAMERETELRSIADAMDSARERLAALA